RGAAGRWIVDPRTTSRATAVEGAPALEPHSQRADPLRRPVPFDLRVNGAGLRATVEARAPRAIGGTAPATGIERTAPERIAVDVRAQPPALDVACRTLQAHIERTPAAAGLVADAPARIGAGESRGQVGAGLARGENGVVAQRGVPVPVAAQA